MNEIKLIGYDREFIENYVNQISKETLTNYAREYIKAQKSYFRNKHICKDFIKDQLNLSNHSQAYNRIYRKLISRFVYIITRTLRSEFNFESLGSGLYLKKI